MPEIKDGIVNGHRWDRGGSVRLLFVLKEPNTSDWVGTDIGAIFRSGRFGSLSLLVKGAAGALHNWPQLTDLGEERLRDAANRIAVMNLKKTGGGSSSRTEHIHAHALHNRARLCRRFREIAPTHIVACGTFEHVCWLLDAKPKDPDHYRVPRLAAKSGLWVIPWVHPAARGKGRTHSSYYQDLKRVWPES